MAVYLQLLGLVQVHVTMQNSSSSGQRMVEFLLATINCLSAILLNTLMNSVYVYAKFCVSSSYWCCFIVYWTSGFKFILLTAKIDISRCKIHLVVVSEIQSSCWQREIECLGFCWTLSLTAPMFPANFEFLRRTDVVSLFIETVDYNLSASLRLVVAVGRLWRP